jgi:SAM-dependent methyltransferase
MNPGAGNFDDLADAYDRYRLGYTEELYDALFEYGLSQGARVLDIGTGTGLAAAVLIERGCVVTGIDPSERMLERARRRCPLGTFVVGTADALPWDAATFDAATSAQSFHWFDQRRALEEIERVVRPGGTVAVWWKALMRGDALTLLREQTATELGLDPPRSVLANGFEVFDASDLADRRLRVIPWIVKTRVDDYLGYERSRARAREAYGDRLETYFARLAERLGPPESVLSLGYLHYLYLGRVPEHS